MVAIDYDPIELGYVKSLASPSDQVTGIYFQQTELVGKRLQILKELLPSLTAATVFWDRFSVDQWKATEKSAVLAKLDLFGVDLGDQPYDYLKGIATAPSAFRSALVVMVSPVVFRDRQRLAEFSLAEKIPAIYALREFVNAGGLISYGANISALYERAADYVDRIAKGANPAELPVEQPTKFELAVNVRTAKALGIDGAAVVAAECRRGDRIAGLMSPVGRYCCKSRKSNNPKNLAKVDLWTSLLLRRFSTPLRRSVIDFG